MQAVEKQTPPEPLNKETISRKEIVETYLNLPVIDDPVIADLVNDRKLQKQKQDGMGKEAKALIDKLQKQAIKLQADIAEINGGINYIDTKIVQRHIQLTGQGK